MAGREFLTAQQRERRIATIPVVVMTALADIPLGMVSSSIVAYLHKPLDLNRLTELIEEHYVTPLLANAVGAG